MPVTLNTTDRFVCRDGTIVGPLFDRSHHAVALGIDSDPIAYPFGWRNAEGRTISWCKDGKWLHENALPNGRDIIAVHRECEQGPKEQPQTDEVINNLSYGTSKIEFGERACTGVKESILQEAQRIIHGPRREGYGHPKKNFDDTARVWSVLLGVQVTGRQVGQCMIALKLCRDMKKQGRDNLTDIAGYAGCMELLDEA